MKYIYDEKKRNYLREPNFILHYEPKFYSQMGSLLSLKLFTLISNLIQKQMINMHLYIYLIYSCVKIIDFHYHVSRYWTSEIVTVRITILFVPTEVVTWHTRLFIK